MSLTSAQDI